MSATLQALHSEREPERLLLSMADTAASLGVSVATLYSEIKAGELQTTRIGDRQLTTREQREQYIARKQRSGAKPRPTRKRLLERRAG